VADEWQTFLLRYGELAVKSDSVRRRFEQTLEQNIREGFARQGASAVVDRTWGRFFVDTPNPDRAREVLEHTFGLVHSSPVDVHHASLDEIEQRVRELAPDIVDPGDSFAIRARRTGDHDFQSPDVEEVTGAAVLDEVPEATVDLDDPDREIHVEVRQNKAYVFTEFVDAPGGLPRGSQGTLVVPFKGPRSPATAWLSMRRGSSVHGIVPACGTDLVEVLEAWAPSMQYTVLEDPVDRETLLEAAVLKAKEIDASAVALGEHEAMAEDTQDLGVTVLRPLAGLPGKRWPEGAYAVSKDAADQHPGRCLGESPHVSAQDKLDEARVDKL
jgi:hypothetical protein